MMSGVVAEVTEAHLWDAASARLTGTRTLVVGASTSIGYEIAETLAFAGCELFLTGGDGVAEDRLALLRAIAQSLTVVEAASSPARSAQLAAASAGRLDCCLVVTEIGANDLDGIDDFDALQDRVASKLANAVETTRVIANRMGLTWSEGAIVNVLMMPPGRESHVAALVFKDAIARLTRAEAARWADVGITIHAVVGVDDASPCTPPVPILVTELIGKAHTSLSGVTFTARAHAA